MSSSAAPPAKSSRRAFALGALALLVGCGPDAPAKSPRRKIGKGAHLDPAELFPADLNLVVRIDVGRMRSQLGPAADALKARAEAETDERIVTRALERARVAWIGLRLADLDAGDRVLVVEGDVGDLRPDPALYSLGEPVADGVSSFDRRGRVRRSSTARILHFGERVIAFVSPAEVDSVTRVLERGPDRNRRDPPAEGIVSVDLRPRRLPPSLERRFPSIGSIIRGIARARGSAAMDGETLRVEIEIQGVSAAAAERTEELIGALREGGSATRYAALFTKLEVERVERTVRLRWGLPPEVLRALASAPDGESAVQAPP
ncbi:hypothetical protein [Polyangium aurulentum]|uniref:hypothetical protein n=1 Tax=Polyangium aurulentum TaxID=2567896 RepID=UPI0010AEBDCE|nr:hypothetical protein [Polyangium aurulentum]UQA59612.1 hypothetical protein E8A73_003635 [Polyangium aurulentum]